MANGSGCGPERFEFIQSCSSPVKRNSGTLLDNFETFMEVFFLQLTSSFRVLLMMLSAREARRLVELFPCNVKSLFFIFSYPKF